MNVILSYCNETVILDDLGEDNEKNVRKDDDNHELLLTFNMR